MNIIKPKKNFSKITISINSPENIQRNSGGPLTNSVSLNYKTNVPEYGGLLCEKIFGPTKDYTCFCGSYSGSRYKGVICDKCGVLVEDKKIRRERFGHIALETPIVNILFFKQVPNKIALILGLPSNIVNNIIYYESYYIFEPGIYEDIVMIKKDSVISATEYDTIMELREKFRKNPEFTDVDDGFVAKTGGEAIYDLLARLNLDELYDELKKKLKEGDGDKNNLVSRLKLVRSFIKSREVIENKPEWMVFKMLPVLPSDLRPLMIVDGNVTTVDLNELYKDIISSNIRIKRIKDSNGPEVVLRNEKRMLQCAVDNLIDNSSNKLNLNERKLKSLSDLIKGKEGRFRQNLLGKRVDYSGRSVIVINPKLRIYECGVPKGMAVELFKPMIMCNLIKRGYVTNTTDAEEVINNGDHEVFDVLEKLIKGYPVLLNRAPTLHRMNFQAFQPILTDGKAIELNPLVCSQFNADFDGDQMAIHIPITLAARLEASTLLLAGNNVLKTSDGTPCFLPIQDIILGLYYLTIDRPDLPKPEKIFTFASISDINIAITCKKITIHTPIKYFRKRVINNKVKKEYIDTTPGRVIFNSFLPENWDFINVAIYKGNLKDIIQKYSDEKTNKETVEFLDNIKTLGFDYSYLSGLSFKINDISIPKSKENIINSALETINVINSKYSEGLISDKGRYNQVLDTWAKASVNLSNDLMQYYKNNKSELNTVYMMLVSGARGSWEQLKQIAGMKGLISKSQKDSGSDSFSIIEHPITSNYKEGLDVFEYFISTYGGRKGMTDTALKTANAGHLTRKLVDVVQDVTITADDCGTLREYVISKDDFINNNSDNFWNIYMKSIVGRISSRDIKNIKTNEIIVKKNEMITEEKSKLIYENNIEKIYVRSVLTCKHDDRLCSLCYGNNLASNTLAQKGDTVGIIAAQSIGEPGTQLTLNTFHFGGIASSTVLESSKISKIEGIATISDCKYVTKDDKKIVISNFCKLSILHPITSFIIAQYNVPYGSNIYVNEGDKIKPGDLLFDWDPYFSTIYAHEDGKIIYENFNDNVVLKEEKNQLTGKSHFIINEIKNKNRTYILIKNESKELRINVSHKSRIYFKDGDNVKFGDIIIKTPKILVQSTDITGGLPRVSELFEAKSKSNPAILSDIDGIVKIVSIDKNVVKLEVDSGLNNFKCMYSVPLNTNLAIQDGDIIKCGDKLNVGEVDLPDILKTQGYFATCKYLIKELQSVYALQGINIKEKHIAIIVRQMLSFVEIIDNGDTDFIVGEVIKKQDFLNENKNIIGKQFIINSGDSKKIKENTICNISEIYFENKELESRGQKKIEFRETRPAKAKLIIRGISQVSLNSDGFLAPASFQSTMSVLSQAAISATVDNLTGIKANIIAGRKIKAGTGIYESSNFKVKHD